MNVFTLITWQLFWKQKSGFKWCCHSFVMSNSDLVQCVGTCNKTKNGYLTYVFDLVLVLPSWSWEQNALFSRCSECIEEQNGVGCGVTYGGYSCKRGAEILNQKKGKTCNISLIHSNTVVTIAISVPIARFGLLVGEYQWRGRIWFLSTMVRQPSRQRSRTAVLHASYICSNKQFLKAEYI